MNLGDVGLREIIPQTAGAEWGSDGLVRGSGRLLETAAPHDDQLLLAGIANGDLCSRLVYAKRSLDAVYIRFYNESATLSGQSMPGHPQARPGPGPSPNVYDV